MDRTLTVASANRTLRPRKCTGNVASVDLTGVLSSFVDIPELQTSVYTVIRTITEMCDYFTPERSVVDKMVEEYIVNGKVK